MAELIPMAYRVRMATRRRVRRWVLAGTLALTLAGMGVSGAFLDECRTASAVARLETSRQARSTLFGQADELVARRAILAERMGKLQRLSDDRVLVSLLQQLAARFSTNDCLEYMHIDTRSSAHKDGAADAPEGVYTVRLNGVTSTTQSLAELLTRLSAPARMPVTVMLEKSNRENLLDGQVIRFQINCEKTSTDKSKGAGNTAG